MTMEFPDLADDGLMTPEVGAWGERKYRLLSIYAGLFSTSMKQKWKRVYIDLFAGAGRVKLMGMNRIVSGSPLLALDVKDPFDRYILCEQDPSRLAALKSRVASAAGGKEAAFVEGDVNASTHRILNAIPAHGPGSRVLSFCFADPFNVGNLKFATIRALAQRYMDFMVLIPSFMDANRNAEIYARPDNRLIDDYLGDPEWRAKWIEAERRGERFGVFILDRYRSQMAELKYLYKGLEDFVEVRSDAKNLPLYHLAFFSRHDLGDKFWDQAKKYSTEQKTLF